MKKAQVVLIGNYGATNLGDEAILQSILKTHPELDFTVFSHNPEETYKLYGVKSVYPLPFGLRSLLRGSWRASLRAIKKADLIILGGGGLFTDEKIKAILLWGWHFLWAKISGKKVFLYANSIGPLNSHLGRYLVTKILKQTDFITVRDELSARLLRKLGINNFEITADPAFLFSILLQNKQPNLKKIAISLRHWVHSEEKIITTFKILIPQLEEQGYQIMFIPMDELRENDTDLFQKIAPNGLIVRPQNFEELIGILNQCAFTIGMRLHFLIASALAGTPFIALSYSQKTDSFCCEMGVKEDLVPLKELNPQHLIQLTENIQKNRATILQKLPLHLKIFKAKAQKNQLFLQKFFKQ